MVNYSLYKNRSNNADKKVAIYCRFRKGTADVYKSIGVKVKPSNWNQSKQRVKATDSNYIQINRYLDKVEELFQREYLTLVNQSRPVTKSWVIKVYEKALKVNQSKELVAYLRENSVRLSTDLGRGKKRKQSTLLVYNSKVNVLCEAFENKGFLITNISDSVVEEMQSILIQKGLKNSSINELLMILKQFLKMAVKDGLNPVEDFLRDAQRLSTAKSTKVYFTEEEVEVIANTPLPTNLIGVRDIFVFSCYTALRYVDTGLISKDSIVASGGKMYLKIVQTKTNKAITIPLSSDALSILQKYNFNLPVESIAGFNRKLKTVIKNSGFTEEIQIADTINGVETITKLPRYELVSSHTGRRSCITNLANRGVPLSTLTQLSGHSSIQTLEGYLQQTAQQKVDALSDLDFFK